jgi:hypothetical protein
MAAMAAKARCGMVLISSDKRTNHNKFQGDPTFLSKKCKTTKLENSI